MLNSLQVFLTKLLIVIKVFNSIDIEEDCIIIDNPIDYDLFINNLDKDIALNTNRRIFINCDKDFRAKLREEQEIINVEEYDESTLI